ncbi:hypothetical protein [Halomonas cupida]|uniref:Uncharacterized protein n=1 Tax=Halomonas cupida TaxID=44933 RepID=A0A1M7MA87_9GAMM|nr:hypothetical protein [Halomonas cupida]GEN25734.1 hypothetical protein HCU01_36830 [Halomonas cupida]SHM87642.1 hypothetical protein SAMN05660971_04138 [Halomonas cupida]
MDNHKTYCPAINLRGLTAIILSMACLLPSMTLAADNDYPTAARVDYVIGCMAANGQDYLTMQQCSCSIDVIAEQLSYDDYEAVATVMGMQEQRGEMGVLFRTERSMQDDVEHFRSVQADADLRCF